MTDFHDKTDRLGILVGGGPAPGINSVISSATIEARNSGLDVVGIYDGFSHLMEAGTTDVRVLEIAEVTRIHFQGGSILRTSRANPTRDPETLRQSVQSLRELGIGRLITIGGDDTAFSASEIYKASEGTIRVVHVPKTIDNDLPLPGNMPTFGFETARHLGTQLVLNLMEDSRTTSRWYFVVVMGRTAGHLALGIGKASSATITVIPEEFPSGRLSLDRVCDVLEGSILKRRALGQNRGLAIIAEGIGERIEPEELAKIPGVEVAYDQHGHLRLGDIPLDRILKSKIQERFAKRGETMSIVDRTIGYELRSASPIPFDIDYTRTLGYGAVRVLLAEPGEIGRNGGGLVCLRDGRLDVLPFHELRDPETGRTRVRRVDIESESYHVAREYMIRLEKEDMENPEMLRKLAAAAKMPVADFEQKFGPIVE